jgi:hypothetical protein
VSGAALDPAVQAVVTACRERIQLAARTAATAETARLIDEGHLLPLVQGAAVSAMAQVFYDTLVLMLPADRQYEAMDGCMEELFAELGRHHNAIGAPLPRILWEEERARPAGATVQ